MLKSRKSFRPFRPAVAKRHDNEEIVRNGLAVTPSMALELTNQGLSISAMNSRTAGSIPPTSYKDWDVPIEYQRGMDALADGFQQQQTARHKLRDFVNKKFDELLQQQQQQAE